MILIEGSDGCGKKTQSEKLLQRFNHLNYPTMLVSFPNYSSASSGPVQLYLSGKLGTLDQVNSKQASMLYAIDRFCTIREQHISQKLDHGINIICDRYVESNMIHQAAKHFGDDNKIMETVKWIKELEYETLQLPRPDIVIFLDLKPEISLKLRNRRLQGAESTVGNVDRHGDIHEANAQFMADSYKNGLNLAHKLGWIIVDCNNGDDIYPVDYINDMIYSKINLE